MRSRVIAVSLAFVCVVATGAQEPVFRAQSNVVIVPTLVRDAERNAVYGLAEKDFIIEDDGVPQTVHLDEASEEQPVSIVVVLQLGRRADYELPRVKGLRSMLSPLMDAGHARVAMVTFDQDATLFQDFTSDSNVFEKRLGQLEPGNGGAAIVDAVHFGVKLLNATPKNSQRVLLLIGETRDHGSTKKPEDLLRELGTSNIVIYALTFSPSKSNVLDTLRGTNNPDLHPEQSEVHEGPDLLAPLILAAEGMRKNAAKTITAMTGGEYTQFATSKNFDRDMNAFSNHLYSRYVLSFAPSKPHPGLHHLTVRLRDPGKAAVLARESYWAEGATSGNPQP